MVLNHVDGGFRAECDISQDEAVHLSLEAVVTVGARICGKKVAQRSGPVFGCWCQFAGITLFSQNCFAW